MKGCWNPKYEYWTCWTPAISRNCKYGVVPSCLGIEVIHALLTPDPPLLLSVGEKDGELLLQQHLKSIDFLNKKNASALKNVGAVMEVWLVSKTKNKQREKQNKTQNKCNCGLDFHCSKQIYKSYLGTGIQPRVPSLRKLRKQKEKYHRLLGKHAFTSWAWNLMKVHPVLVVFPCIRVDFVAL